jgi:uncharacterized membrane protein
VLLAPWSVLWSWPTLLPPRLEAYIRPVGTLGVFTLFPWIAFVFVGAYVGDLVAAERSERTDRVFHLGLGAAGLAIAGAGALGRSLPAPFAPSEFWTTSLSFFLIRVGVMTLALAGAWLWMRRPTSGHWSPLILLGRNSLFVYWVHVAIAYGAFSAPIHKALSLPVAIAAFILLTLLMIVLTIWWSRKAPTLRSS